MPEQRLRLGRERESPATLEQKERSHTESVAGEEQLARLAIPHGERELSVEVRETVRAPLLVGVGEDFGVAVRREAMAERGELVLELRVVEDLAVLHHPVATALVGQRLIATGEIDDGEPRIDHPELAVEIESRPVRPTVPQLAGHRAQQLARGVLPVDRRFLPDRTRLSPTTPSGCPGS